MMPLRRNSRSYPASFYSPFCKSNSKRCSTIQRSAVVDGAHEILAVQWGLRHIVQYQYCSSCLVHVLCTLYMCLHPVHASHLARSNAGKCSAPGRPVPALCLATRASKPSRFCSLLPSTCITHLQPGELVQVRPDRCAGMLERMRACVRLASRTRFGRCARPRDMHQRASFISKRWRGWKLPARFFPAPLPAPRRR